MSSRKTLIFRLSSLGDVVLASACLQAESLRGRHIEWVTGSEYVPLLRGHPALNRVWGFDRRSGLQGWINLLRELHQQGFDEVFDLHRNLRTAFARLLFAYWSFKSSGRHRWVTIKKQRFNLWLYYILKSTLPKSLRPTAWVIRFSRRVGGTGNERPDLGFLRDASSPPSQLAGTLRSIGANEYACVMPGARWPGKRWSVSRFAEALSDYEHTIVVLGTSADRESAELLAELRKMKKSCVSGIDQWDLRGVAQVLAGARFCLANDTGLAHIAEAVGTPSITVYGPTTPQMGFGPWREQSCAVSSSLWCRPCSKDGSACFRPFRRYLCLDRLDSASVKEVIARWVRS